MATILRYLSSLALALSATSVSDPIRDSLQATADRFSRDVGLATALVAIGVALEATELIQAAATWVKRLNRRRRDRAELKEIGEIFPVDDARGGTVSGHEPKWVKVALRVGILLVVIGVVGEWKYGSKLEDAHNAIHAYDVGKLLEADKNIGDTSALVQKVKSDTEATGREQATIAASQKETAKAQKEFQRNMDTFETRLFDRSLNGELLVSSLEGKPKKRVQILYPPYDVEAHKLASEIFRSLGKGSTSEKGAGWIVLPLQPIMPNDPEELRLDASYSTQGFMLRAQDITKVGDEKSAVGALQSALMDSIFPRGRARSASGFTDFSLPSDLIQVVIGSKPTWWWEYHFLKNGPMELMERLQSTSPKK
jgi:hypothetical protein